MRNRTAWLLLFTLALLVAVSYFQEELAGALEGSDDRAVTLAEAHGAVPVASLPFEPSERGEKWLFVLQGLLGVGLLAIALRPRPQARRNSTASGS